MRRAKPLERQLEELWTRLDTLKAQLDRLEAEQPPKKPKAGK